MLYPQTQNRWYWVSRQAIWFVKLLDCLLSGLQWKKKVIEELELCKKKRKEKIPHIFWIVTERICSVRQNGKWHACLLIIIKIFSIRWITSIKYLNIWWVLSKTIYVTSELLSQTVQNRNACWGASEPIHVYRTCVEIQYLKRWRNNMEKGCTCHSLPSKYSVCDLPLNLHSKSERPKWYFRLSAPSSSPECQFYDRSVL